MEAASSRSTPKMKRCPQCNRVETDEALKFCRVDGATLVSDSIDEVGTIRLGSGHVTGETETGKVPQTTSGNINCATTATTALPPQTTYNDFSITTKTRLNPRGLALIGAGIVVVVVAIVLISYHTRSSNAAIQSIAVMPFVNASGNADNEYLSDGMTESLIRSLSQLPNLSVKARSSVFRYKGKDLDAKTIGKELGVQAGRRSFSIISVKAAAPTIWLI
jgi:hypothetical protein